MEEVQHEKKVDADQGCFLRLKQLDSLVVRDLGELAGISWAILILVVNLIVCPGLGTFIAGLTLSKHRSQCCVLGLL